MLAELLAGFPFAVLGFHSDGGSEYINGDVAKLLEKLRVEFTRSLPRHTNDNALVESKNGSVIRKQFGYPHIAQHFASDMNDFCRNFLNPYINFHRPCYFAVDADAKGNIRKRYPHELIMTPFDKLKTLPPLTLNLRPGITLDSLERQAQRAQGGGFDHRPYSHPAGPTTMPCVRGQRSVIGWSRCAHLRIDDE